MQKVSEEMLVTWKGRSWRVMGIGFWMPAGGKVVEWNHPSAMPRGLRKAWREARRAARAND